MKQIYFIFFVLLAVEISFISCSKEDGPISNEKPNESNQVTPISPTITISTSDPTILAEGGDTSISFNASADWTASSNVDWITLSTPSENQAMPLLLQPLRLTKLLISVMAQLQSSLEQQAKISQSHRNNLMH